MEKSKGFIKKLLEQMNLFLKFFLFLFFFSNKSYSSEQVKSLGHVRLFATPQTVAHQAPSSMGFSRKQYWSGLPFPSPEYLPDPGIKPRSPTL